MSEPAEVPYTEHDDILTAGGLEKELSGPSGALRTALAVVGMRFALLASLPEAELADEIAFLYKFEYEVDADQGVLHLACEEIGHREDVDDALKIAVMHAAIDVLRDSYMAGHPEGA